MLITTGNAPDGVCLGDTALQLAPLILRTYATAQLLGCFAELIQAAC